MIEITHLYKTYPGIQPVHALQDLTMSIGEGEFVSVMGASGSGKSTLLNILGMLDDYESGTYYLDGQLIRNLTETKAAVYRNNLIGFVFQSFNLISFKNALDNVALPLYYKGVPRKKRNLLAMEYLDRMGLKDWWHNYPHELSGGQKQRIAIARALIANPKKIQEDEPTGQLDSATTEEVMQLLTEVHAQGITLIIVTHEWAVAEKTNRIIRLKDGRIESDSTHPL
jgi:putative ABC transport system ATP-binding protein